MKVEKLKWDSDFFNFGVSKIDIKNENGESLKKEIENLFAQDIQLIYVFTDEIIKNKNILELGGILVDDKIIYEKRILQETRLNMNIEQYTNQEISHDLLSLAYQSGEYSRYKDKRLPEWTFEKMYKLWIENSQNGKMGHKIFVFKEKEELAGMITLKIEQNLGKIGLIAVSQNYRGRNIGSKLIAKAESYLYEKNISNFEVATQLSNKKACDFYLKNGFKQKELTYIYHFVK